MAKEFKKLLGNRLYITLPDEKKSNLTVDDNTKESLQKEMLIKLSRLTIYEVGAGVTEPELIPGAEILIDPSKITQANVIPLSKEKSVLLISTFDVIHIW